MHVSTARVQPSVDVAGPLLPGQARPCLGVGSFPASRRLSRRSCERFPRHSSAALCGCALRSAPRMPPCGPLPTRPVPGHRGCTDCELRSIAGPGTLSIAAVRQRRTPGRKHSKHSWEIGGLAPGAQPSPVTSQPCQSGTLVVPRHLPGWIGADCAKTLSKLHPSRVVNCCTQDAHQIQQ